MEISAKLQGGIGEASTDRELMEASCIEVQQHQQIASTAFNISMPSHPILYYNSNHVSMIMLQNANFHVI
ncbi:hypothetical protein Lal_00026718 [Lupinus albus]|nr:hypothetical protein Lal_00026718 [Lupinus albus]